MTAITRNPRIGAKPYLTLGILGDNPYKIIAQTIVCGIEVFHPLRSRIHYCKTILISHIQ